MLGMSGQNGHTFRTYGADGRNAEAFNEEMQRRFATEGSRLPRTVIGKVLLAAAVVAVFVLIAL